ncbi:MAG: glycosyltransferase [Planctomycetota bacterium]|nr:MAG: glycosyltransferase [Planctomycetota bacterium]
MSSRETTAPGSGPVPLGFCITELDPGGAEQCLVELATRLDRQRFQPTVYCLGPRPASNPSSLADRLEAAGVTVRCFGARQVVGLPVLLVRLRRQLAADAPVLLQTFLFHANVAGAVAARWARVPHVVGGIRVAEHEHRWHLAGARRVDRWVERHVCVSESVRDFSQQRGGLPAEKLLVIPNGVDVVRYADVSAESPERWGIAPARRLIAFVGRLDAQKGLSLFLEGSRGLFKQFPAYDLIVAGEGPERRNLEATATQLGLAGRVHFVGYRQDVPQILASSELVIVPSLWEGMSNVVLQAMAAGKPIVATRVEGVDEQLGPQAERQTVERESAAFAERAIALLADESGRRALGEANRRRAAERFSLEAMVGAYERLYSSLLDGHG